jgi:hypothetical protein
MEHILNQSYIKYGQYTLCIKNCINTVSSKKIYLLYFFHLPYNMPSRTLYLISTFTVVRQEEETSQTNLSTLPATNTMIIDKVWAHSSLVVQRLGDQLVPARQPAD